MENNLKTLKSNIGINGLAIEVLQGAVSDKSGTVFMETGIKDFNFIVGTTAANGVEVKAYSVDEIMDQFGWDDIDLLKIDIEGHEKLLLSSNCDWLNKVKNIVMEIHYPIYTLQDVRLLVEKYRFTGYAEHAGLFHLYRN